MELNPQNAFGEVLLDLIDAQYQGNYDQGLLALMQVTGLSEEAIVGIINGDIIVESQNILGQLMQAFPDADAEDMSIVTTVASGVEEADRGEAEAVLQEQLEAQQYQATQNQAGDQYATADGGYDVGAAAGEGGGGEAAGAFSAYARKANFAMQRQAAELAQLKNYVANFASEEQLSRRLERLSNQAASLESEGILPPAYRRMLIGDFANGEQRVARFSRMSKENGVDVQTMLFASEYALNLLGRGGQYVEFKDYSVSHEDAQVANFNASLDAVVEQDFAAIFDSN
jgi:hypothetical protein